MAVSFEQISVNLRTPGVFTEYDASQATTGPGVQEYKGLIIGQKLPSGNVAALVPTLTTNPNQAKIAFGEGSICHRQAIAWFDGNKSTELTIVALDDPAGSAAAAGNIVFTGPATAAGTLSLYLGGEIVQVGVASGDSSAEIATAVVAAIAATSNLCVSSAVDGSDTSQVNITALNKGLITNEIDVRFNYFSSESTPAGVGFTITALSGGSGAPAFTPLFSVLGDEHYTSWAVPYNDAASLAAFESELSSRASSSRQIEALGFTAKISTVANLSTYGNAQNGEFLTSFAGAGTESPTPSFEASANYAAVAAFHLQIDPARPLQTLELNHIKAPATINRFTQEEANILLFDGISTGVVDASGNVRIQRAISFYKETANGAPDTAYLDITTPSTLSFLRVSLRARIQRKYPRHKLASDGTRFGQGQKIVTPKVMKAEIISLFDEWEDLGLVEGVKQFISDLIVERNSTDRNRLDILLPPDIVNQLRVTAIQIQFRV